MWNGDGKVVKLGNRFQEPISYTKVGVALLRHAEIKHSDLMLQVMWLVLAN